MIETLTEPLTAFVTWLLGMALRSWAPDMWESLGTRRVRLAALGVVSVMLAIIVGVQQGMAWPGVLKLALSALAGSVLIRETTKGNKKRYGDLELTRTTSIRTKTPQPHYD